jgi:hypothetical protein
MTAQRFIAGLQNSTGLNPVLRCECPIDRALLRSPQIYLWAFSAEFVSPDGMINL